ncbi:putative bifunctional diguanylate cyclase/phosphodiesterase, partial [Roseovarius sp. D0-M9]|uniref:putative bifunctional diguanylate cyclase/phosphodiesterase n=1 Tax=Roseovarius sp. D0-M9 TaxID=3127117 RepID=UPI00300FB4AB
RRSAQAPARVTLRHNIWCGRELTGDPHTHTNREEATFSDEDRAKIGHFRDIAQENILDFAKKNKRLKEAGRDAEIDTVTGLLNRRALLDRLDEAVDWTQRRDGDSFGIFILEIDRFNDLRSAAGKLRAEALLLEVGRTLANLIPAKYIYGRLQRGTLIAISPQSASPDMLVGLAALLTSSFDKPLSIPGGPLPVRVRIGISRFPLDGSTGETLIGAAEQAMIRIPKGVNSSFALADPELNTSIMEELDLERRLYLAVHEEKLSVVYQPKIEVSTERVSDVEALVRWTDTELGAISPGRFIPIAEKVGLIGRLGEYVLKQACENAASWTDEMRVPAGIAVNVSTLQLEDPTFIHTVQDILKSSGLKSQRLILEITESALMSNFDAVLINMSAISDLGVRFAIDDFGTGNANFSYLRDLPVYGLKIDKSFVDHITEDESHARICQAMIILGRALNLNVVAEGVQSLEQATFLKAYGVNEWQGYHFSKPLSSDDFLKFVQERNASVQG